MSLYTIKHLKAPWPAGAKVGDVIEFAVLPGWAAGKCEEGGAQATVFAKQEVSGDGTGVALSPVDPNAARIAATLSATDEQARQELQERLLTAEQALAATKADLEAALVREATLQAALAEAQQHNAALASEQLQALGGKPEDKSQAKGKR
ncbi:hypothetical protein DJFAAGMI_01277 [Comamonas sp. PE63]|uniref:Uncharacterized protein n=1 Tax=Comamonas brasiliensis TaxID=1812482 RepID=A0ABS5LPW4_9BURK|nr:hypothetical protein [Comamonas sp. PE63]MBS3018545.1 hypothetical protein [Comamonas sp. PE63]